METAERMKLLPSVSKHANGVNYEIVIDAHTGGMNAAIQLVSHIKKYIVPALASLKRHRMDRLDRALDRSLELQVEVERSREYLAAELEASKTIEAQEKKDDEIIKREKEVHNHCHAFCSMLSMTYNALFLLCFCHTVNG